MVEEMINEATKDIAMILLIGGVAFTLILYWVNWYIDKMIEKEKK